MLCPFDNEVNPVPSSYKQPLPKNELSNINRYEDIQQQKIHITEIEIVTNVITAILVLLTIIFLINNRMHQLKNSCNRYLRGRINVILPQLYN